MAMSNIVIKLHQFAMSTRGCIYPGMSIVKINKINLFYSSRRHNFHQVSNSATPYKKQCIAATQVRKRAVLAVTQPVSLMEVVIKAPTARADIPEKQDEDCYDRICRLTFLSIW